MINAIIQSRNNTLITELPVGIYTLYERLTSVGINVSPKRINISDNDEDEICVKLYSESNFGNHLIRVLNEENTLADANLLAIIVQDAREEIRDDLEQNILYDQYSTMDEVINAVRSMTDNIGPVKAVFFCPLTANVYDGECEVEVDNSFLRDYAWAIEDAIKEDAKSDENNMAYYFNDDEGIKNKLASMSWGVATYRGKLYGMITCNLTSELTESETDIMKDWISGQNSDGWGEGFEQRPIDTEDGDLYVSFWNGGDDYAVMTQDELDEYIENEGLQMGGM